MVIETIAKFAKENRTNNTHKQKGVRLLIAKLGVAIMELRNIKLPIDVTGIAKHARLTINIIEIKVKVEPVMP